jgi:predicted RNase H-like HicB family nuclease
MGFEYPAKVEQDEAGFYLVTFPHFPEAATLSATPEDHENDSGER